MEEEIGTENLDNSRKQALCSKLEQLLAKLDSTHAELILNVKSDIAMDWLRSLREQKDFYRGVLKLYQRTTESGNQTSLVSSTSAGDNDPNDTVIDRGNGTIRNPGNLFQAICYTRKHKRAQYC